MAQQGKHDSFSAFPVRPLIILRNTWLNFAETGSPGGDWPGFDQGHSRCFGNRDNNPIDTQALQRLWEILDDENLRGFL